MNQNKLPYCSHQKSYFALLAGVFLLVLVINLVDTSLKILSFQNFLSIAAPVWLISLLYYLYQKKQITRVLENYLNQNHADLLYKFYQEQGDTESHHVLLIFLDEAFLKEEQNVAFLKKELDKISFLLVKVTVITIMAFLISSVFIVKYWN